MVHQVGITTPSECPLECFIKRKPRTVEFVGIWEKSVDYILSVWVKLYKFKPITFLFNFKSKDNGWLIQPQAFKTENL